MKTALVTGTSSGLGYGLAGQLLREGWTVYGCSRRGCDIAGVRDAVFDLTDHDLVPGRLDALLGGAVSLDLVVLNAGIVGEIRDLSDTPLGDLKRVMDINLWANKVVMDWLLAWGRPVRQIVMISSGAAVLGNRGWGGYALSKAALNMLARLYAHEMTDTHVSALAPGIIDTPMMDYLCEEADSTAFPALNRLRRARGTEAMPGPEVAAGRILSILPALRDRTSGDFVDLREILDPEEYARVFRGGTGRR